MYSNPQVCSGLRSPSVGRHVVSPSRLGGEEIQHFTRTQSLRYHFIFTASNLPIYGNPSLSSYTMRSTLPRLIRINPQPATEASHRLLPPTTQAQRAAAKARSLARAQQQAQDGTTTDVPSRGQLPQTSSKKQETLLEELRRRGKSGVDAVGDDLSAPLRTPPNLRMESFVHGKQQFWKVSRSRQGRRGRYTAQELVY